MAEDKQEGIQHAPNCFSGSTLYLPMYILRGVLNEKFQRFIASNEIKHVFFPLKTCHELTILHSL